MTDAPVAETSTSVPTEAIPTTRKLPLGVQPWMMAAALGLGAGVVLGIRLGQLLRGPVLPARAECPECARRDQEKAKAQALADAARAQHAPPVSTIPEGVVPPATPAAPATEPEPVVTRQFSAQAIPEPVTVAAGDGSVPDDG